MEKRKNNLRITVILAMLAAISIISGKYLAIRGGDIMRFSLENMPIIFAGMAFGPIAGGAVGLVADIVGCIMVGYTINPLVAIGAATIGITSGIIKKALGKTNIDKKLITAITVAAAHLVGSVIIKTIGLAAYYDISFPVLLLWRVLNYLIVGVSDGVVLHILLNNKGIQTQLKEIGGEKK